MPHIKDKNLHAAEAKIAELKDADLKKLTIEQVASLALEVEATEKALKLKAAEVKKLCNEVYTPLCNAKKELEIQYAFLSAKLDKVKAVNPAVAAIAKLVGK